MKVILPEDYDDIKLKQYQEFLLLEKRTDLDEHEYAKRKIKIFCELPYHSVDKMKQDDYVEVLAAIDKAIATPKPFQDKFTMYGITFGFHPNLYKMQSKEYFDLMHYDTKPETLHELMAILFRPIVKEVENNGYEIEEYTPNKKYADCMKEMPLSIVQGALVFFWSLAEQLLTYTLKYSETAQAKELILLNTLKSGVGMQALMKWHMANRGNTDT